MARGIVLALAALVVAALLSWHAAKVAVQTILLLPALFPSPPLDPLTVFTGAPTHETTTLQYAAGNIQVDLFRPTDSGRHGAIMLLLGAGPIDRLDLADRFAEALARTGIVVMLPQSDGLLAERLSYAEVDGVRADLTFFDNEADVDPRRVGIVGLSAAGGLAIVASAEPDMRDRVTFVNSFGSYDDARSLLVDVASRSIDDEGQIRDWQPEPRTQQVVAISLIDSLRNDVDRALLQRAFVLHEPIGDDEWATLSAAAQPLRDLLAGTTRERATADVAALPAETQDLLRQISPFSRLDEVRAHLYLMHDLDDTFIPFTESRALVRQAPPGLVQRYTEFSIFAHIVPNRSVPWQTFVPDLWRLFWHVHAVLMEVV